MVFRLQNGVLQFFQRRALLAKLILDQLDLCTLGRKLLDFRLVLLQPASGLADFGSQLGFILNQLLDFRLQHVAAGFELRHHGLQPL